LIDVVNFNFLQKQEGLQDEITPKNVRTIHKERISAGSMSLVFIDPPLTVVITKCNPAQLQRFLERFIAILKGDDLPLIPVEKVKPLFYDTILFNHLPENVLPWDLKMIANTLTMKCSCCRKWSPSSMLFLSFMSVMATDFAMETDMMQSITMRAFTCQNSNMISEEDLTSLLIGRLEAAKSLEQQLCEPKYSTIQGVSKLRNRLASELKFLDGIANGKTPLEKKYIETSNVTHFENIVAGLSRFQDVQAVFHTFSILDPDTDS
ncbi:hypothetical protein OESDEN_11275, partial [Oesophagostomum dentatum]